MSPETQVQVEAKRGRGRPRKDSLPDKTLDVQERGQLQDTLDAEKKMLSATENFGVSDYVESLPEEAAINKDKIKARIQHLEKVLNDESPRKITNPALRDKVLRERKELEQKFKPYIESWRDLGAIRRDSPEYRDAFRKAQERHTVEPYIRRWKELGKALDPDDPSLCNLDQFRS